MKKRLFLIVIVLSLFVVMNGCASMATIANSLTGVDAEQIDLSNNNFNKSATGAKR